MQLGQCHSNPACTLTDVLDRGACLAWSTLESLVFRPCRLGKGESKRHPCSCQVNIIVTCHIQPSNAFPMTLPITVFGSCRISIFSGLTRLITPSMVLEKVKRTCNCLHRSFVGSCILYSKRRQSLTNWCPKFGRPSTFPIYFCPAMGLDDSSLLSLGPENANQLERNERNRRRPHEAA